VNVYFPHQEPPIDPPKEDDTDRHCHVWFDMDMLVNGHLEPDDDEYLFERPFNLECTLHEGHSGPHVLEICFTDGGQ